jgi:Na+/H+-dicarboxylate symporter
VIKLPLYLQIIAALIVATIVGILLGAGHPIFDEKSIEHFALPCTLIIKALRTLATPLIFLAIIHTFITTDIPGKSGRKLFALLMSNTTVAIIVGLIVANLLQPGVGSKLAHPTTGTSVKPLDPLSLISDIVPDSVLKPLVDNNVTPLL